MSIDLKNGTVIPAAKVPKLLGPVGRNGSYMSIQQVVRGILRGLNGHKLAAVMCGSRWLTTVEAVQEWVERQAESACAEVRPVPDLSRRARRLADEHADRELRRRGV